MHDRTANIIHPFNYGYSCTAVECTYSSSSIPPKFTNVPCAIVSNVGVYQRKSPELFRTVCEYVTWYYDNFEQGQRQRPLRTGCPLHFYRCQTSRCWMIRNALCSSYKPCLPHRRQRLWVKRVMGKSAALLPPLLGFPERLKKTLTLQENMQKPTWRWHKGLNGTS